MKLRLPNQLVAALMAAFSATLFTTLSSGSAAHASVTFSGDALTTVTRDEVNNVYNDGAGTFYIQTENNNLDLSLTICLESLYQYQDVHDYNGFSPFVTWSISNAGSNAYGLADIKTTADGQGITGYWDGNKWATAGVATYQTLLNEYSVLGSDDKHYVTLNITNRPTDSNNATKGVMVTAVNTTTNQTASVYTAHDLRSSNYTGYYTQLNVNTQYVTSLTLNTASVLDMSDFELPKDYTIPFVSARTDAPETSVGRIMFIGDSITHGEYDMTWRWQLFKTFVDNDIENEIVGPKKDFNHTSANTMQTDYQPDAKGKMYYGGVKFNNVHYAQSSGRTRNIINGGNVTEKVYDESGNLLFTTGSGASYGSNSADKVGNTYDCNTYAMMIGTNDILSDTDYAGTPANKYAGIMSNLLGGTVVGSTGTDGSYSYTWTPGAADGGNMGTILNEMNMTEGDTFYVISVPTWALMTNNNHNGANDHATVAAYNGFLKTWTDTYNASHDATVKFVDINKGLVDKTATIPFFSNKAFFNNNDSLHPSEQGALIIAGNLAQGMGLAGRTGGLTRAEAGFGDTVWNTEKRSSTITLTSASAASTAGLGYFTEEGGFTVDFNANFGDGESNGWLDAQKDYQTGRVTNPALVQNALSVTVGDGTMGGTLKLSEGYILWHDNTGDNLLYCRDNSALSTENLRIAYNAGSTENNIDAGYYVWLGDMLIGQGLTATAGDFNGISFSVSGTGTGTIKGLTFSDTAYAPSTTLITSYDNGRATVIPMPSHDSEVTHLTTSFSNPTPSTNAYATANQATTGELVISRTGTGSDNLIGAVGAAHTGNVSVNYHGLKANSIILSVNGGAVTDGNVSLLLDGGTEIKKVGKFDQSGNHAFHGVYQNSVGGDLQLEVNDATVNGSILMGHASGTGTISGATKLIVNAGASIGGNVYGGSSAAGSKIQGGTSITITGGEINGSVYGGHHGDGSITGGTSITITGGHITGDVEGGNKSGSNGTIAGGTAVTVQGNKALIDGNISADTVTLEGVENSGYSDGFDQYEGNITATNMKLSGYTADAVGATLNVSGTLTAADSTNTTISKAATIGTLSVEAGSNLTFDGKLNLTNGLQLNKSGASVTFNNGFEVTTGTATQSLYDMVLSGGAEATINCEHKNTARLLATAAGTTLNFGEKADVTVAGIYNSSTDSNSNGTLNVAEGATVVSNGRVRANTMNLSGSLTVKGNFDANTLNLSGGTLNYTNTAATAGLTNIKVTGEEKSTLSGNLNVTTLSLDGSSLDIDGGTYTLGTLQGNDTVARAGIVTIKNDAAVTAGTLKVGAQGQRYLVENGSSLTVSGLKMKLEAANGENPAALYSTYGKTNGFLSLSYGSDIFVIENAKVTMAENATLKTKFLNAELIVDGEDKTVTLTRSENTLTKLQAKNGNITVQNADNSAASLVSLNAGGGDILVQMNQATELNLHDLVLGDGHKITATTQAVMTRAAGDAPAIVTLSGTATEHALLQATGTTTVESDLALSGHVDMVYTEATQGIDLAGNSLTLSAGETTIYLSDEMMVTLNTTNKLVLFTNASWVNGITLNPVEGNDKLSITPAGLFIADSQGNALGQQYQLAFNSRTGEIFVAPEPATATLSLLALAALAARRRRK